MALELAYWEAELSYHRIGTRRRLGLEFEQESNWRSMNSTSITHILEHVLLSLPVECSLTIELTKLSAKPITKAVSPSEKLAVFSAPVRRNSNTTKQENTTIESQNVVLSMCKYHAKVRVHPIHSTGQCSLIPLRLSTIPSPLQARTPLCTMQMRPFTFSPP